MWIYINIRHKFLSIYCSILMMPFVHKCEMCSWTWLIGLIGSTQGGPESSSFFPLSSCVQSNFFGKMTVLILICVSLRLQDWHFLEFNYLSSMLPFQQMHSLLSHESGDFRVTLSQDEDPNLTLSESGLWITMNNLLVEWIGTIVGESLSLVSFLPLLLIFFRKGPLRFVF